MNERIARWFRKAEAETGVTPPEGPIAPEVYVGADREKNERYVREGFVEKARRFLAKLPMAEDVAASYFCMLDPATPTWVKGVAAASLAYFILPIDAIVDAIPVAGMMDDVAVLTAALTAISAFITPEHREKARRFLKAERITPTPDAGPGSSAAGPAR